MKTVLLILFTLFVISCKKEIKIVAPILEKTSQNNIEKLVSEPKKDSIATSNNKINIGFYEDFEQKLKLKFDSVPELEFKKYDYNKLFFNKSNFKKDKNFIYLEINQKIEKFKVYKNYGTIESWSGHELIGFYNKLNLFALTNATVSESLGFSEMFLIDKLSGYQYNIVSIGDGAVQTPIPSPKNKFLIYWHNTEYKHQNSEIRLLRINQNVNPENLLTEYASFGTDQFAVEKITWVSDQSFLLKGYQEIYDGNSWVKNYSYFKTIFK